MGTSLMGPLKTEIAGELFTGTLSLDGYSIAERRLEGVEFLVDVKDGKPIKKSLRVEDEIGKDMIGRKDMGDMWKFIQQNDCFDITDDTELGYDGEDGVYQEFFPEEKEAFAAKTVNYGPSDQTSAEKHAIRKTNKAARKPVQIPMKTGKEFLKELKAKEIHLNTDTDEVRNIQKEMDAAVENLIKVIKKAKEESDKHLLGNFEPIDLEEFSKHFDEDGKVKHDG